MIYETSYVIEGYDEKSAVFCFIEDIEKKKKRKKPNGLKSVRSYKKKKKILTRELLEI